jgi:hypothetical protein
MRIRAAAWVLAAAWAFAGGAPEASASNEIPPGVAWAKSWDGALLEAAERGVPVLVSFANDD